MSRSYRKTPITAFTRAGSHSKDKTLANRRLRRTVKTMLASQSTRELPTLREISDIWDMAKENIILFNPTDRPELLRK